MLNFEEFKSAITSDIKNYLPDSFADAEITIHTVGKNNNVKLTGLLIKTENPVTPMIYLEDFYEKYQNGNSSIQSILESIADIRVESETLSEFGVKDLADFDKLKNRITCRLVNLEANKELLSNRPYTPYGGDLAITYHINADGLLSIPTGDGKASIPINNSIMEAMNVNVNILHDCAIANLKDLRPEIKSMADMLKELMIPDLLSMGFTMEEAEERFNDSYAMPAVDSGMYVITNHDKMFGANVILDQAFMEHVKNVIKKDFYIIPSSVHELLLVVKNPDFSIDELTGLIGDVNGSQVAPQEVLSDHPYEYDEKSKSLVIAGQKSREADRTENKPSVLGKIYDNQAKLNETASSSPQREERHVDNARS